MEVLFINKYCSLLLILLLLSKYIFTKTVFNDDIDESKFLSNNNHIDEWAVHLDGDLDHATEFAKRHGLELIGQVGTLSGFYRFKLGHERKKRMTNDLDYKGFEDVLKLEKSVQWLERQKRLVRNKRDYIEDDSLKVKRDVSQVGIDPLWSQMWYLNRQLKSNSPDMNVTGAWSLGYSGKGVAVTFLDDGLEHDHPDLHENYDPQASHDVNSNDDDPMPRYDPTNENKHGTRCAGEVAALANNSICSVGVAFHAGVGGIRMLDGDVTDSVEASSLSFNRDHIDIYSASWGPDDNGEVVDGPGVLARKAFVEGVQQGRKGKGSIFVWASGNGGRYGDACSCDGYVNSIYTLAISSTSEHNQKPWYLEECPSTLATTYSSGDERGGDRDIVTTDIRHECTSRHTGTSAAAPLAAGIIALALEANPNLTWRDVMFIVVLSSRPKAIESNNYMANKRGFLVSSRYGFGLMDAGRMVELAKSWQNVPNMVTCSTKDIKPNTIPSNNKIESIIQTDGCENTANEVNFIEQVEIVVTILTQKRGSLEINIISPSGTKSQLLPKRNRDSSSDGFKNWSFMSVQTWGENPTGTWKLEINGNEYPAQLESFYLNIHGTKDEPVNYRSLMNPDSTYNCHHECVADQSPCGPTEYDCNACVHFSLKTDDNRIRCVPHCPIGYFTDLEKNRCLKCHSNCLECNGPSEKDCTNCDSKLLKLDSNECVSECPKELGYFQNANYECEPCDAYCSKCSVDSLYCTECKANVTVNQNTTNIVQINNFCVTEEHRSCGSGLYMDKNDKQCKNCDITCIECNGPTQLECIKCASDRPYLQNQKCVATCDDGFYLNETASRCFPCNSKCQKCQYNASYCLTCKEGYTLNYHGQDNTCSMIILYDEKCHSSCYECFGSKKNQCRLCKHDLILHNGECLSFPPIGYYKSTSHNSQGTEIGVFKKCDLSCTACIDAETCTSCHDRARLINGKCYEPCSDSQFINTNGTCTSCVSPCTKCLNETTCLACAKNKYILNNKCYATCPLYYYSLAQTCQSCHSSCETCTGSGVNDCLTCNLGFKFNGKMCVSNCPDGTYYDVISDECKLCNLTLCEWCIDKSYKCTKCQYPLVLDRSTSTCKKCCSRSVYGKTKADFSLSCCNCPPTSDYTGYCLDESTESLAKSNKTSYNPFVVLKNIYKEYNSITVILFSLLLLSIAIILIMYALYLFKKSCKEPNVSVQYSPLNQLINEYDDHDYKGQNYPDTSLNDEEDDFEINTNDFRSFNGKIKSSRIDSKSDVDFETKNLLDTQVKA